MTAPKRRHTSSASSGHCGWARGSEWGVTRAKPIYHLLDLPLPGRANAGDPGPDYASDPRAQGIAAAAELNAKRDAWLNPPDLVVRVPEVVPGYPDRILSKDDAAAETEVANADQPLQPVPRLARPRPCTARRGGGRGVRLGRRLAGGGATGELYHVPGHDPTNLARSR